MCLRTKVYVFFVFYYFPFGSYFAVGRQLRASVYEIVPEVQCGGNSDDCGGYSLRVHWWCMCRVLADGAREPHTPSMVVGGGFVRWYRRYQRTLLNGSRATKMVVDDDVGRESRRVGCGGERVGDIGGDG